MRYVILFRHNNRFNWFSLRIDSRY